MKTVGIDLAGKNENPTGYCLLEDGKVNTNKLYTNEQIIERVRKDDPQVVAIDAPFDFPDQGMFRKSDMLLKEAGFNPLSPKFEGMKVLVNRAKTIISELKKDYRLIEVFPSAADKILSIKKTDEMNDDEYDALLCAFTAKKFIKGEFEDFDGIILPKP